jgi:hypothetical protein
MLDILKKLDKIESKKSLNESTLTECPPEMGMAAPSSGPASLNISAGNASEMAQILKALMSIDSGKSEPSAIVGLTPEPEGTVGGIAGAALGGAMGGIPGAIAGGAIGDKLSSNEKAVDEWDNTPEEKYQDHKYMTKDLSGGINRQKKMYKPAAKGDNPMAVESIKDRLYRALNEKKAKPDFLDMDKDGNKKEPMKKALKDKKVKEAAKPDFLDMDKDGNKKEPMKKAVADKKKAPFKK